MNNYTLRLLDPSEMASVPPARAASPKPRTEEEKADDEPWSTPFTKLPLKTGRKDGKRLESIIHDPSRYDSNQPETSLESRKTDKLSAAFVQ